MGCGHWRLGDAQHRTPSLGQRFVLPSTLWLPSAHSRNDGVASFSVNKWPPFRLSRFKQNDQSGPLFGKQVALFSVVRNSLFGPPLSST